MIVDRSMTVREVGRIIRSRITVNISQWVCRKRNNDGSECKEGSGKRTKELIRHLAQVFFCLKCRECFIITPVDSVQPTGHLHPVSKLYTL